MKFHSLMILTALSTSAFAGLETDLLDLSGIGQGSSFTLGKDVLIPAGAEYVSVYKLEPGVARFPGSKLVTACTISLNESSPVLRKIPSNYEIKIEGSEAYENDDGSIDKYSFDMPEGSAISEIYCSRFIAYDDEGKEIKKVVDLDDLDKADASGEAMTVLDLNTHLNGLLSVKVAEAADISIDLSDREEGKDVIEATPADASETPVVKQE